MYKKSGKAKFGRVVGDITVKPSGDKAGGKPEDFIVYIIDYVAEDLIEGIIEKLTEKRYKKKVAINSSNKFPRKIKDTAVQKTKGKNCREEEKKLIRVDKLNEGNSKEILSKDKTVQSVNYAPDYLLTLAADKTGLSATDKKIPCTTMKITEQLIECIIDYVADDIIEKLVNKISKVISDNKADHIIEFITGFISDNEILHAVLNLTGFRMMRRTKTSTGDVTGRPIDYLSNDIIQKFTKDKTKKKQKVVDVTDALTEQITESLANNITVDILEELTEDTINHLTEYITEYIIEDFFEEIADFNENVSKCSARSCHSKYNIAEETAFMENIRNADLVKRLNIKSTEDMWKDFTDEEYESELLDPTVNLRSFFTYVHVKHRPSYIVNVPRRPTLNHLIREKVSQNLGATMRIRIGDRIFDCIPNLLKVYSPWFANKDWHEEHLKFKEADVPILAFDIIYKWLRFQTPILLQDAIKVLQAARYLQFDLLVSDCWDLLSQPHVREKIAFRLFLDAEKMPALEDVREILLSRVRSFFLALVGSGDFQNLKLNQLLSLLNRDSIGVNCEVEVFFAAVRWLSKSKQRLEHIKTVMKCVRFAYMPMPMLFSIRNMGLGKDTKPYGTTERVLQEFQRNPEMPQMLYDAMTYISLHFQNELEGNSIDPRAEINQKLVYPRRWIYHPKCPYHKSRLIYPYQHSLTQEDFDNYVSLIQKDWIGDEPPANAVLEVEFDGVVHLSPKLSETSK